MGGTALPCGLKKATLREELVAGSSMDIYRCFDQINRSVLRKVMAVAGFPPVLADVYFRHLRSLLVSFHTGSFLGFPRREAASIPQGCPFSMCM